MIAAKNHKNGVANPYAQMRKDFGYEFCRAESEKNPFVAGPLKRTDCSLVSDGAAALVLTDAETAKTMGKAVNFRATAHAQDFLPMSKRDILQFEGCTVAWQRALQKADVTLSDLSFVETHDCFTVAELIEYEAMGLTPRGQGAGEVNIASIERAKARWRRVAPGGCSMSNERTLSLSELNNRIAILQDNIRQLVEQAAVASGELSEQRVADRIHQQNEELERLTKARDALLNK